jgi:hypothetical protein
MLTQLARLSIAADGRYASDRELQFLEDYLESVESRIAAYEKICENEEKIVHQTKMLANLSLGFEGKQNDEADSNQQKTIEQYLADFERLKETMSDRDITQVCSRDMTMVLRCSAAAMLFDDLDRLREGVLLWYETIVRSFGYKHFSIVTYKIIQDAVRSHLSPEEAALIMPALQLNHSFLSA